MITYQKQIANIYIEADKYKISQVVYNLLNNAIKFTNEGSITISVKRKDDKVENKKAIVVSVKDTGKGIDSEMLPRLFTRFATKSFSGTGLGLFVSKHIVEAHDGEIWAENNVRWKRELHLALLYHYHQTMIIKSTRILIAEFILGLCVIKVFHIY